MNILASSAVILFSILLSFKLFEICSHAWIVAKGPVKYDSWRFTRVIVRFRPTIRHIVAKYVFRYPVLIISLTVALVVAEDAFCVTIGACVLLIGVWIEVVRILIDRIILGPNDSDFRRKLAQQIPLPEIQVRKDRGQQERLQRFVSITFGLVALVVTSYTAIYCAAQGPLELTHFSGVPNDSTMPFHFLYFSVITTATVGYGDIQPDSRYGSILVGRFLCASQVTASFALLVVLATSVTVTFLPAQQREDTQSER
jgi:hypothetical protein